MEPDSSVNEPQVEQPNVPDEDLDLGRPQRRGRRFAALVVVASVLVVAAVAAVVVVLLAGRQGRSSSSAALDTSGQSRRVEYSDNRRGAPVFADDRGTPVSGGVPGRIPYGTAVTVVCFARNQTGMARRERPLPDQWRHVGRRLRGERHHDQRRASRVD